MGKTNARYGATIYYTMIRKWNALLLGVVYMMFLNVLPTLAEGQSVTRMVKNQTQYLSACDLGYGTIVDDGGETGSYSNNFNGYVQINAEPGVSITLSGSYETESGYDYFKVWDGSSNSGTLLANNVSGSGSFNLTATSGTMTIYFYSDGGVTRSGFVLHWSVDGGALNVSNITTSSATLSWSSNDASATYTVLCDGNIVGTTTGTSYNLTGLTPSMLHEAEVHPGNRCNGGRVKFRTLCGTLAIPFTEDFDDQTIGQMPPCWDRMMTYDDPNTRPQVTGLADGNRYLMLGCGSGNTMGHFSIVMAPRSSQTVWPLRVMLRASHDNTRMIIGACDTTSSEYDSYGFVPIDTVMIASSTQWMLYDSSLTVPAGKSRLAFKLERAMQTGNGHMVYIDNLNMIECGVTDLTISHVDTSSAEVSWGTFGVPDVTLTVSTATSSTPIQTIQHASSPLTLTDLTPDTRYIVGLMPDCGITQGLPSMSSFVTEAATNYVDSVCESFNGSYYNLSSGSTYQLPPVRNLAGKDILFRYRYSYSGYRVVVGLVTYADDMTDFVPLDTITTTDDEWLWAKITVPNDATQSIVVFKAISRIYIDDIQVGTDLWAMTQHNATRLRSTSATIEWDSIADGGCDSVTIAYAPYYSFDINSATRVTVGDTNRYTINGLTPGTFYGYMLFRSCSAEPCSDYPSSFYTPYIDAEFPYCEGFESQVIGNNTWQAIRGSVYQDWSYNHSGSNSMRMESNGTSSYYSSIVALPETELPQENVFISFYALTFAPGSRIQTGGQDDYDYYNFTPTYSVDLIGDGQWHSYTVQVPTNSRYIALQYVLTSYSSYTQTAWIDDVQLGTNGYSDFSLSNLTDTSVTVNFTAIGGTTTLQVTFIGDGDTVTATGSAPSFVVDGLNPNTSYECYMQAMGSGQSCENYAVAIHTPSDTNCPEVTFTANGNSITCHTNAGYADYMLTISGNGESRTIRIRDTLYTIDGLLPSTVYTLHYCCTYMNNGCSVDTTVTTGAVPVPYCIGSSDINYTIPAGWTTVSPSTENNTQAYSSYVRIQNDDNNKKWMYLLLPQLDSTEHLMLLGRMSVDCYAIEIGVLTDGDDTASFVAAVTYGDVNGNNRLSGEIYPRVDLSNLPRGRVAIRFTYYELYVYELSLYDMPLAHYSLYRHNYMTIWTEDSTADFWVYFSTYRYLTQHISTCPTEIYLPNVYMYTWEDGFNVSQWSSSYRDDCGNKSLYYPRTYLQSLPFCLRSNNATAENRPMLYRPYSYPTYYTYDNASRLTFGEKGLQHAVLQEINIDSVKHLKMSFIQYATRNVPLVVGVMVDALDTSTFTPVDTIAPNYYGADWDTSYVDFSTYEGNGRWIAFRYKGNSSSYYNYSSMYIDDIKINTCLSAMAATAMLERYNTVVIDVPGIDNPDLPFYAEYGPVGFISGTGNYVIVDTLPFRLTLPQDSTFDIYFHCNANDMPDQCTSPQYIKTRSLPLDVPTCIDFEECSTGVRPAGWMDLGASSAVSESQFHSGTKSLSVGEMLCTPDINIDSLHNIAISLWFRTTHSRDRLVIGAVMNPDDPTSFVPLRTLAPSHSGVWERIFVSLSSAPDNAHFIALRAVCPDAEDGEQSLFIDDMMISSCAAFGMQVVDATSDSITIDWEQTGTPTVTLTVSENSNPIATYNNPSHPLTISPVNHMSGYRFVITSTCSTDIGTCSINYTDSATVVAPGEGAGCVDATNLESEQSYFFTGTYGNPYSTQGVVNFGSTHPDSRHTVCRDTTLRDPRTGDSLRTVPEGAAVSFRLGNWSTNDVQPEAEGVVYSLGVDTTNYSLLLLRYAAVLQNPMHAAEDQPRFRLELLDSNYHVIDSNCAFVDFIADRNLGWHQAPDNVLWKDWTAIGIDMSAYHGQQIFVRLTTFDCNEGSHYGYAYFTLECMKKMILAETCGMVDSNRFTAPSGFNYRWYTATSATTISTQRIIMVPTADMATYYCELSSVGDSTCGFTLEAYGGPRQPLARCDTSVTISNCQFDVTFTNTSVISPDGINPIPTNEQVESVYWNFGNGEVSTSRHGHTVYDAPGTYTVTLVASIGGGACTDTLVWPMTLASPIHPNLTAPDTLCHGSQDTIHLHDGRPQDTTGWIVANGLWCLPLNKTTYNVGMNNYTLTAIDTFGCPHNRSHTLGVNPSYRHEDTITICTHLLPYTYSDTMFLEGTTAGRYDNSLQTAEGCDSSYHLWLTVNDTAATTFNDTTYASICDNQYYTFYGTDYNLAGQYASVHLDSQGLCDSIHTLQLSLRPTSATDTMADVCDNFRWYGINYTTDTATTHTMPNIVNCDSVTTLHLTVRHSTDTTISHYVLENDLPYVWNGITFHNDTTAFHLKLSNSVGCDSNITFNLTVYLNQDTVVSQSLCEGNLPYMWNGVSFSINEVNPVTNIITHQATLVSSQGADSVVTMQLRVLYNSTATIRDTLLHNALNTFTPPLPVPVAYTQNENDSVLVTLVDTVMVVTNAVGCDSTVHYCLSIYRNYLTLDTVVLCDNQLPTAYLDTTLTTTDSIATFSITRPSVHGADSVIRVTLRVHPTYEVGDTIIICPNKPAIYEGIDYGGPVDFDSPHLSVHGCDSLVHVSLQPRDTLFRLSPLVSLDTHIWHPYDTTFLGCAPQPIWLNDTSNSVSREWSIWPVSLSDDTTVGTNNIYDTVLPIGIYSFRLIAVGAEGCVDTIQNDSAVYIFQRPTADFTWVPDIVPFHDPQLDLMTEATPADSLTYSWLVPLTPGGGQYDTLANNDQNEGRWHYAWEALTDSGQYEVLLVAYWLHNVGDSLSVHCTDTARHPVIIVNTFLQFPNLVTPNGDGINDTWEVVNLVDCGQYPTNEVWIYNQWGALVFHAKNIASHDHAWNPNDTNSPDGTYFFRFSGKGRYGVVKQNGVIEVLR